MDRRVIKLRQTNIFNLGQKYRFNNYVNLGSLKIASATRLTSNHKRI